MTVDQLIAELSKLSKDGYGKMHVRYPGHKKIKKTYYDVTETGITQIKGNKFVELEETAVSDSWLTGIVG